MAILALPRPDEIVTLLHLLLGRTVTAKPAHPPLLPGADATTALGTFASDDGKAIGVLLCDLGLACSVAAALTLFPAGIAAKHAVERQLPDNLRDNFKEVLNIAAQFFNQTGAPHAALQGMQVLQGPMPPALLASLKGGRRIDLDMTIQGYGIGKLALALF